LGFLIEKDIILLLNFFSRWRKVCLEILKAAEKKNSTARLDSQRRNQQHLDLALLPLAIIQLELPGVNFTNIL
jgi:hypothetical protein